MSEIFDLNSSKEKNKSVDRSKSSSKSKTFSKLKIIDSDDELSLNNMNLDILANSDKIINEEGDAKVDLNSSLSKSKSNGSSKSESLVKVKKEKSSKRKAKEVLRENKIESIRREKNEYLFKLNKANGNDKRYTLLDLSMNDSLDDIRNEYERICKEIQVSTSVKFYKTVLVMGTRGLEMLNSQYDPLGIDLDGFAESMTYSIDTPSYDEVLTELAEKYKSMGNVSPELKLVGLLAMSGFGYVASKKISKSMEDSRQYQRNRNPPQQFDEIDSDTDSDDSSAKMPRPEQTFNSNVTLIPNEPIDIEIKDSDMESVLNKMHQNAEKAIVADKIIEIAPKRRGRPPAKKD